MYFAEGSPVPYSFVLLVKLGSGCGEYFANEDGKFKAGAYRFSKNMETTSNYTS